MKLQPQFNTEFKNVWNGTCMLTDTFMAQHLGKEYIYLLENSFQFCTKNSNVLNL